MSTKIKEIEGNLEGLHAIQLVLARGGNLIQVPCLELTDAELAERRVQILENVNNFADWNAVVESVQIQCGGTIFRGIFAYENPVQEPAAIEN